MLIARQHYLDKLISKKNNGMIKVITGIRRSGKSFLLFNIYHAYLNAQGINDANIIELALDEIANARDRNPLELDNYIRKQITDSSKEYYIFLDEIQKVAEIKNPYLDNGNAKIGFVDVLLGLMKMPNVDIYVTGSNSRMLSSDILTEFRGRGDEVRVNPLTYKEFYNAYTNDKRYAWREYYTYGGLPFILSLQTHEDKSKYLKDLFAKTYLADVIEHNKILHDTDVLEDLLNIVSSAIGSLTNPTKLANSFASIKKATVSANTISRYLDYFIDAFILYKAYRYDIKGRKYIGSPLKYYFTDIGLRNARLNFRQQEENHIMENIIYNELVARDYDIDVGIVTASQRNTEGKSVRKQLEVDFVANKGNARYYIQSAFSIGNDEKHRQEINSLINIPDSFKKIVVVRDNIMPWYDENGIYYVGIEDFLLDTKLM